nr:deoxyribose-phosphate aldolase [Corynebacterium stationis]
MSDFHALSLLGASAQQVEKVVKELGSLPHIGNQRVRLVVDPPQVTLVVQLLKESQLPVIVVSVAGYPTGRHHTLIKASEARLAVQSGAEEIWVSVDDTITDSNTHLSEFITIREACPDPIELGLIVPADANAEPSAQSAVQAASLAAFQRIVSTPGAPAFEEAASPLEIVEVDL